MAAACNRSHVVHGPYDGNFVRNRIKERSKIDHVGQPVQVNNVTFVFPNPIQLCRLGQSGHRVDFVFAVSPRADMKIVESMDLLDSLFFGSLSDRTKQIKPSCFSLGLSLILNLKQSRIVQNFVRLAIIDSIVETGILTLLAKSVVDPLGSIGRAAVGVGVVVIDFHNKLTQLFWTISNRVGPTTCSPASPDDHVAQNEL